MRLIAGDLNQRSNAAVHDEQHLSVGDSMILVKLLGIALLGATLTACVSHPSLEHPDYLVPEYEPVAVPAQEKRGSALYSPYTEVALFEDLKGYRRGDIINVLLAERTAAQKAAALTFQNRTRPPSRTQRLAVSNVTTWGHSAAMTGISALG